MMTDITLVCGAIATASTLGYQFHIRVVVPSLEALKGIRISVNTLAELVPIAQELKKLVPTVQGLVAEMSPNGGDSMRDSLDRIENGLAHNRNVSRTLLQTADFAYLETDHEGRCLWANEQYLHLVSTRLDELQGYGWYNVIAVSERETVSSEWAKARLEGKTFVAEYTCIPNRGKPFRVKSRTTFSQDYKGRVVGSVVAAARADSPVRFVEEVVS